MPTPDVRLRPTPSAHPASVPESATDHAGPATDHAVPVSDHPAPASDHPVPTTGDSGSATGHPASATAPCAAGPTAGPAAARRHFLLYPDAGTTVSPAGDDGALPLPAGVAFAVMSRGSLELFDEPPGIPVPPENAATLLLEPVELGGRRLLLVATVGGLTPRLNGAPAPVVALLDVKDHLRVGDAAVWVSEYLESLPGPPPAELVGKPCGLCRLPVEASSAVYRCDCGVLLHLEGEDRPAETRLECALVGDCPNCGTAVRLDRGPVWTPDTRHT